MGAVKIPLLALLVFPGMATFFRVLLVTSLFPPQTASAQSHGLHLLMQATKLFTVCGFLHLFALPKWVVTIAEVTFSCGFSPGAVGGSFGFGLA